MPCGSFADVLARPAAGEPIKVRASQLPLRHFDAAFRRAGVLFAFALLGARALAAQGLRRRRDCGPLAVPGALYAGHALLRSAVYQLHVAGAPASPRGSVWRCARCVRTRPLRVAAATTGRPALTAAPAAAPLPAQAFYFHQSAGRRAGLSTGTTRHM